MQAHCTSQSTFLLHTRNNTCHAIVITGHRPLLCHLMYKSYKQPTLELYNVGKIQGVTGGTETSGECSLGHTIPI